MIDTEYLELQNAQCQLSGDKKAPNVKQRRKVQRKSVKCCQDPYQATKEMASNKDYGTC